MYISCEIFIFNCNSCLSVLHIHHLIMKLGQKLACCWFQYHIYHNLKKHYTYNISEI